MKRPSPADGDDGEIVSNLRAFVSGAHYIGVVATDKQEADFLEALAARKAGNHCVALTLSRQLRNRRCRHENPTMDVWAKGDNADRVARMRAELVKHGIELPEERASTRPSS